MRGQHRGPRRSHTRIAVALFAATAALTAGAAALGPASAGALMDQQQDCMNLPLDEWMACLVENAGGGFVGGVGGGGSAGGGSTGGGSAGAGSDDTETTPPYNGIDPATGDPRTISAWYSLVEAQFQDQPDLLRALQASEREARERRCAWVSRRENDVREEIRSEDGPSRRFWRRTLALRRSEWRFFECVGPLRSGD